MISLVEHLRESYGISFRDESLLMTAFTHTSYANEVRSLTISDNERLEFLGDAVLQLVMTQYIYQTHPDFPEGDMSKMRSSFVRSESLAYFARKCHFGDYLKLGKGEEKNGGRYRDATLEDTFESFLGALYLDQGLSAVDNFIHRVMIPELEVGNFEKAVDYKTALQEALQVNGDVAISYEVISEKGPAHARVFEVDVLRDGTIIGHGTGKSKKAAEQAAAKEAIRLGKKDVSKSN